MAPYPTLRALMRQIKRERFLDPANVSDEEVLGVILAGYFGFDAGAIMRVCAAALEDANFHTESAKVLDLERQVMGGG